MDCGGQVFMKIKDPSTGKIIIIRSEEGIDINEGMDTIEQNTHETSQNE